MKRHVLILALIALVSLVTAIWWLTRSIVTPPAPFIAASPNFSAIRSALPMSLSQPLMYQVPSIGKYQGLSDPRWSWWNAMKKQDRSFEWQMPIKFYGKVIDENNVPIQGAKTRFQWTDKSAKGTSEKWSESNADGMFSLTDEKGKNLGVYVTKVGYHAGSKSFGDYDYAAFFEENYHSPNKNNPVLFQLVRRIDAEPLFIREICNRLSYEQGSYYYDLQRGKISRQSLAQDGLKVTITRSQTAQGRPFDWAWTVEGVNAMVRPTTDEFPQLAPTDAYARSWKIEGRADSGGFQREGKVRLYVHTTGDRYAVVDLQLSHPNKREIGPTLNVKSYFNPSGSRNLEYDPRLTAKSEN